MLKNYYDFSIKNTLDEQSSVIFFDVYVFYLIMPSGTLFSSSQSALPLDEHASTKEEAVLFDEKSKCIDINDKVLYVNIY